MFSHNLWLTNESVTGVFDCEFAVGVLGFEFCARMSWPRWIVKDSRNTATAFTVTLKKSSCNGLILIDNFIDVDTGSQGGILICSMSNRLWYFMLDIILSALYCQHEGQFYELYNVWEDRCYRYNCTTQGIFVDPLQQCEYSNSETFEESSSCPGPQRERTDRQTCCTEELFCPTLPPRKLQSSPSFVYQPHNWWKADYRRTQELVGLCTCISKYI